MNHTFFLTFLFDQGDGVVVGAFALHSVDLGPIPLVKSYQNTLKMVSSASLLGTRHLWEVVKNKSASSLVVSLGKALNGMPPFLRARQVALTPWKWQLLNECERPVQKIAKQFIRFLVIGE